MKVALQGSAQPEQSRAVSTSSIGREFSCLVVALTEATSGLRILSMTQILATSISGFFTCQMVPLLQRIGSSGSLVADVHQLTNSG